MKENRAFRVLSITKKQTGFSWNFLKPNSKCTEVQRSSISAHGFSVPNFSKISQPLG